MKKTENRTYLIGGLFFLLLVTLTFFLVFKGAKGAGSLYVAAVFTFPALSMLAGLLVLFFLFDALRLYFVFRAIGTRVAFLLMLKLVFINIFASGVTPLATGGGFAQIYFLTKNGVQAGTATAATTIRTVIATIAIFCAVPLVLFLEKGLNAVVPIKHGFVYSVMLIGIYCIAFSVLLRKERLVTRLVCSFIRMLEKFHLLAHEKAESLSISAGKHIGLFNEHLRMFWRGQKIYLVFSIVLSLCYLVLLFLFPYVLIRAMGKDVHIITVLSIQVLITFLIYFTPTPGGSGVAEGGFAIIFSNFLSSAYVPPLTFYWRFLTMYLGMLIGLAVFYREIWRRDREASK